MSQQQRKELNHKYVILQGRFERDYEGHEMTFSGSLRGLEFVALIQTERDHQLMLLEGYLRGYWLEIVAGGLALLAGLATVMRLRRLK